MTEPVLIAIIVSIAGSSVVTAAVVAYLHRRKTAADVRKSDAEADATEASTRRDEVDYYQRQVKLAIEQMVALEAEVKSLKKDIDEAQRRYEQRVGELHNKIDNLASELTRANNNLDAANETIKQLRQEVKDGNKVIAELREEITKLLIDKAETKKGE